MSYLAAILSGQDVEAVGRLLDLVEQSELAFFEAKIGDLSVRIELSPASITEAHHEIRAPAVGIYRSANLSHLKVGHIVPAGTIVGRIDTLDQRTDVVVQQAGELIAALVQDGQFVEYGQGILAIAPSAA